MWIYDYKKLKFGGYRDFSTCAENGIMEWWNTGKMGFGNSEQIQIGPFYFRSIFHHSKVPMFQYPNLGLYTEILTSNL